MTPAQIRTELERLPAGIYPPQARQAIGYLMLSEKLSLDEATLRFEDLVASPAGDALARAGVRAKKGHSQ
jgi:hypothetical protein